MKQITLNVIELPNSDMEYHILMDVMESGMQVIWHVMLALSLMDDVESIQSIVDHAINIGREKQKSIKTVLNNG